VIKVLVVDDSALVRKLFGRVLSAEPDMEIAFARDGLEALAALGTFKPDVITLDIHMPQMDGLACLDRIMIERPCPVVMVSGQTADAAETTLEALRLGAVDFVAKPQGAVSLQMEVFAPQFVAKVRAAANARLKASLRLRERIQHRIGSPRSAPISSNSRLAGSRGSGAGLVVLGISTGGPSALEVVLAGLPANFSWPIVIAQHMPASFTGALAHRLDKLCALTVLEVVRPTPLKAGHVYIARGDGDVVISRRAGALMAAPAASEDHPWHPSVDRLVRSAMEQLPPRQIIGVLMTGMGNDGAGPMTELRALGGRTIAESEESAVVWGMPGELVKADGADWVLPVQAVGEKLQQLVPIHAADPKAV
jgi:two-component system chemotaxis response regulator CheB